MLLGDSIIVDVFSVSTQPIGTTGNQKVYGEDIPKVESFQILGWQKGVLTKG